MENYICIQSVKAEVSTNHDFATWSNDDILPEEYQTKPVINGYRVMEDGGKTYWLSDSEFEARFSMSGNMTLGEAISVMESGGKVTREGWNNNAIHCEIQVPDENSKMTKPYIYMVMGDDKFPLDLSCESILAKDWKVVE